MDASVVPAASPDAYSVLLISSLDGDREARFRAIEQFRRYEERSARRRPYHLAIIADLQLTRELASFPPSGKAYRQNPESHALWRWVGVHAPDLVLILGEDFGLAQALSNNSVAGIGRIPAQRIRPKDGFARFARQIKAYSEARQEQRRRAARSPRQLAEDLAKVYGHTFQQPTYLEGMALIGRMKLGAVADVQRLAEPYLLGKSESLGPRATSLHLAGHLVFGELAQRANDPRALELTKRAANLGFDSRTGAMLESMPFHNEMSDSIFMGTAILASAGRLTGEPRYFQMAARHLDFMNQLVRRPDGLYRHSPLTDAAWGRGNAFALLG